MMGQVFDHSDVHDLETCRNPVSKVCVPGFEDEDKEVRVLEPQQTWQIVNRCYLKPAAIAAGIIQPDERFGFHSLRHSLSTWVHSTTKDLKVAQTMLRHSKPDITAGTYIHGVPEENLKAQGKFMHALMQEGSSSQPAWNSLMNARPVSSLVQ
jgi:Phage integrase family